MARPKLPTAIKVAKGTARKDRLPKEEPESRELSLDETKPPKIFNAEAKKHWKEYLPILVEMGTLKKADLSLFEQLCQVYGEIQEIYKFIYTDEETDQERSLAQYLSWCVIFGRSPTELTKVKDLRDQYRTIGNQFGMGAAARGKIDLTDPNKQATSEQEEIFTKIGI